MSLRAFRFLSGELGSLFAAFAPRGCVHKTALQFGPNTYPLPYGVPGSVVFSTGSGYRSNDEEGRRRELVSFAPWPVWLSWKGN
jgi:hypothetical protein